MARDFAGSDCGLSSVVDEDVVKGWQALVGGFGMGDAGDGV